MTASAPSPSADAASPVVTPADSPGAPSKSDRLVSLDALRGFDMIWILGAEEIIHNLAKAFPNRLTLGLAHQFDHAEWAGFRAYDLIFPLFVFIVGASVPFSLGKLVETRGRAAAVRRVVFRGVVLYLLGLLYYGGLSKGFDGVRLMGVLQRIALAYLFAGLLFCFLRPRALAVVTAAVLLGYWVLLSFVPVPGVEHASFAEGYNWTNWFDKHYLPGFKWDGDWDPEGVLSTLPAVASCLLGVFAGLLLRNGTVPPLRKVGVLLVAGAASVLAGYLWGLQFPIIKKLWTSSFVLVAGGYSAMLLALFYLVVDVWQWRRWCTPLVWVGMNAITLYMIEKLFGFKDLAYRLVGTPGSPIHNALSPWGDILASVVVVALVLLLARFLYKRQIFLRV
jgi:predicted acyltransferase